MKVKIILIIFFIFQTILLGNEKHKLPLDMEFLISQNKPKEIVVYDLEVLNDPNLPFNAFTDTTKYESVIIPFVEKIAEPFFMNYRTIWVRGKFDVEESDRFVTSGVYGTYGISGLYGIRLGLVAAANLVYINNVLVGKFDSTEIDKFLWPGSYILPAGLVLKKTNEIAIRFITPRKHLTLISDIVLQNKVSYSRSEKWNNFLYNQIPMGFCVLFTGIIVILLYHLLCYKVKRYFFYILYLLNQLFLLLLIYSPTSYLDFNLIVTISYSLVPLNFLIIILVYQSLFGIYLWKHNIISAIIILPVSVFILLSKNILNELDAYLIPIFCVQALTYIYLICMIRMLNSLKRDGFVLKLCITLYSISFILELIQAFGLAFNIWYHYFYFIYSIPFFLLLIVIYEIKVNKIKRIELEKIESKFLKNNINNNHVLTELAEKKIENIIAFLNENFTEDISREGLASVVDMNPNYMSKLFYQHTGKKINDYINHLRITDATRLLTESSNGKKIIDIALAVGFDSLSTFNRAFKNVYDLTPTEYKKKYNTKVV